VGWSIAKTSQESEQQALEICEATAGDDRRGECRIHNTFCDTGAR
jgi:hypothetical protein